MFHCSAVAVATARVAYMEASQVPFALLVAPLLVSSQASLLLLLGPLLKSLQLGLSLVLHDIPSMQYLPY